MREQAVTE